MYSVTYLSVFDEPYIETKLFKSEQAAKQQVKQYVEDICETCDWDIEIDTDFEFGDTYFETADCGHWYSVKMTYHEDSKII